MTVDIEYLLAGRRGRRDKGERASAMRQALEKEEEHVVMKLLRENNYIQIPFSKTKWRDL